MVLHVAAAGGERDRPARADAGRRRVYPRHGARVSFAYDASGRRTLKEVDSWKTAWMGRCSGAGDLFPHAELAHPLKSTRTTPAADPSTSPPESAAR